MKLKAIALKSLCLLSIALVARSQGEDQHAVGVAGAPDTQGEASGSKPAVVAQKLSPMGFNKTEKMDLERLKKEAFDRCQKKYDKPNPVAVPMLDPPNPNGNPGEGMIFQEELSVHGNNLLDKNDFYVNPRPRAAVNSIPMEVFVDNDNKGTYQQKTWEDANFDYTNPTIQPPIDKSKIPEAGKVMTELIVGHRAPDGGYPQLFDIRSSAYVRFAGYPPQITGASMRLGAHGIFSQGEKPGMTQNEDFPIVRAIFTSIKDNKTTHAFVLLESELFCGAVSIDMTEGKNAEMVVDNYFYTRKDFDWKKDPHTAFVAYSSMLWKTEKHTPERSSDEAHDSDTLTVKYKDGKQDQIKLDQPDNKLRVRDFPSSQSASTPTEWILSNEDRDPAHYADFAPALGSTNYDKRASYKVKIMDSNIKTGVTLYESNPDGEYGDNIVAASTIRENIKKAQSPKDFKRFQYKTTAFYPGEE